MSTAAAFVWLWAIAPFQEPLLPRELAPGVFVLESSQRFGATNQGWVVLDDRVILIDTPYRVHPGDLVDWIGREYGKPVTTLVVTQLRQHDFSVALFLARRGVDIVIQKEGADVLRASQVGFDGPRNSGQKDVLAHIREFADRLDLGDEAHPIQILAQGRIREPAGAVAYLPRQHILFAGPMCVHGPRGELSGIDTRHWIDALDGLRDLDCRTVVPGRGSVGDASLLDRQRRFLRELRRQVGHQIARGRPFGEILDAVKLAPADLVWAPYDHPTGEDIQHVHRELTVPLAPFGAGGAPAAGAAPKALVLVGDDPHDPGPIEDGLRPALVRAGIAPYFAVDVRALSAANLEKVQLLVMLRDGANRTGDRDNPIVAWMTPEQERAIDDFVRRGGGLLALHNTTALYPESGPFQQLVGGTYGGHGPLERFRVNVVDRMHPITRDVRDFEVADEQHTPIPDRERVRPILLSRSTEGTVGHAGWTHEVGQGRVCYLANGHTREARDHPEFRKLLRNAALWCLKNEDGPPPGP